MANSKKRRKIIVFSIIGLALVGLTAGAILKKHEAVISVQTEKVTRTNLVEIVVANGKIQPVVQVKISAEDSLTKTKIVSPITGTISKLNSQLGERVLGTVQNMGTEIMTVADLNEMEARVDIGEVDVVLIKPDQNVRLEVDAFKDRKFTGIVTEVANSSASSGFPGASSGNQQEATKFGVKIRIKEKE